MKIAAVIFLSLVGLALVKDLVNAAEGTPVKFIRWAVPTGFAVVYFGALAAGAWG